MEGVARGIGKIDQAHGRVLLLRHGVAVHLRLHQQRLHRFVGIKQALARLAEDIVDEPGELPFSQPVLPVRCLVERADGIPEYLRQDQITKAGAQRCRRIVRDHLITLIYHRPAQRFKLGQHRRFDMGIFAHTPTPSRTPLSSSGATETVPVSRSCIRPNFWSANFASSRK